MDLDELLNVLRVRPETPGVYVGDSPEERTRPVFGGQFLAQALMAAGATAPGRAPHSLHAYFLRSGPPRTPIVYTVEALRDGRSFSHRQVVASQEGKEVFRLAASFQAPQHGPSFQAPIVVHEADPASFPSYHEWLAEGGNGDHESLLSPGPIEIRFEDPPPTERGRPISGPLRLWFRLTEPAPSDDQLLQAALLAWMTDKTVGDHVLLPHGKRWTDEGCNTLSLDHAMWFHRPLRTDEWLLFEQEVCSTSAMRGLCRGEVVTRAGDRVASVAQEALLVLP